jgi:hypothetical protein
VAQQVLRLLGLQFQDLQHMGMLVALMPVELHLPLAVVVLVALAATLVLTAVLGVLVVLE